MPEYDWYENLMFGKTKKKKKAHKKVSSKELRSSANYFKKESKKCFRIKHSSMLKNAALMLEKAADQIDSLKLKN